MAISRQKIAASLTLPADRDIHRREETSSSPLALGFHVVVPFSPGPDLSETFSRRVAGG